MRDWFREPRNRSLLGALLAPVLTVLMIGVLGCLPASVGDPEHARVDERLSGAWIGTDSYGDSFIIVLRPWDHRTWLRLSFSFEERAPASPSAGGEASGPVEPAAVTEAPQSDEAFELEGADELTVLKTWRVELGGFDFLCSEMVTTLDPEFGFQPGFWLLERVDLDGDQAVLRTVDPDFDALDEALAALEEELGGSFSDELLDHPRTRAVIESVVARHASDPELYQEEELTLRRIPQSRWLELARLLGAEYPVDAKRDLY